MGSEEMGAARGLAICQYDDEPGFYLFYCDDAWSEIADTWHECSMRQWIKPSVSTQESRLRGRSSNIPLERTAGSHALAPAAERAR